MKKNELKEALKTGPSACFLFFLFSIVLPGCISFDYSAYSAPNVFNLDRKIEEGGVLFEWSELDLAVSPWPYQMDHIRIVSPYPLPPFLPINRKGAADDISVLWLRLEFIPKNDEFTFDPMQITFLGGDGKKLQPSGYIGPKNITAMNDSPCRREETIKHAEGAIPIRGPACLLIQFQASPSIEKSFSLAIQGIRKGTRPFPVPDISFEKGSSWILSSASGSGQ